MKLTIFHPFSLRVHYQQCFFIVHVHTHLTSDRLLNWIIDSFAHTKIRNANDNKLLTCFHLSVR